MSKSRILKKKKAQARAIWLADHLGCIKRGTLVEYFKKHPKELSKVQSVSRSQHYASRSVNLLKRDIKTNYHHPGFDTESKYTNWVIHQLENGDFGIYLKYKKMHYVIAAECELQNIPQAIPNPFKN